MEDEFVDAFLLFSNTGTCSSSHLDKIQKKSNFFVKPSLTSKGHHPFHYPFCFEAV